MRIVIAGGDKEADFVIREFRKSNNHLVIINPNERIARDLSSANDVEVNVSDPTKAYAYEEADIRGFDLIISLLECDEDNFVACSIAKKLFEVKKTICTVSNPDNVRIFEDLGIDSPISASYLLTERIKGESDLNGLIKSLSLENDKIKITEVKVKKSFAITGKALKDIAFPAPCNLCCIYRDPTVVIPRGTTILLEGDTIVLASTSEGQSSLIDYIKKEKE